MLDGSGYHSEKQEPVVNCPYWNVRQGIVVVQHCWNNPTAVLPRRYIFDKIDLVEVKTLVVDTIRRIGLLKTRK